MDGAVSGDCCTALHCSGVKVSCLVGKLLGCGPVYLSDWLEHGNVTRPPLH